MTIKTWQERYDTISFEQRMFVGPENLMQEEIAELRAALAEAKKSAEPENIPYLIEQMRKECYDKGYADALAEAKQSEPDEPYVPKTELGNSLIDKRNSALSAGMKTLSMDEINGEPAEQQGEQEPVARVVKLFGPGISFTCSPERLVTLKHNQPLYTHPDRVKAEPLTQDALVTAIVHYEAALQAAFPRGAFGKAYEHWNTARILLKDNKAANGTVQQEGG